MMRKPRTKPHAGDVTMGMMTFQRSPFPLYQVSGSGTDHIMTDQLFCAAATAPPHRPPMSAWLELDGSPKYQVMRFQIMPPRSAQMSTSLVMEKTFESSRPDEMVLATAVPYIAPTRFVDAARTIASRGVSTLVETTVAMEFAVSWKPFMYSKMSATSMTVRISVIRINPLATRYEFLRTMWLMTLPASRQRSATFSRSSKMSLRKTTRMALPWEA